MQKYQYIKKTRTMINANELRLGNIVSYKGIIGKVTWIQHDCITIEYPRQDDLSNGSIVSPELLDGLKLDKQLFIKLGFEENWYGFEDKNIEFEYLNEEYIPCINNNEYYIGEGIKYIHQLQNLYKVLSQKELDTTKIFD